MNKPTHFRILFSAIFIGISLLFSHAQPSGFTDRLFVGGFNQAVGITFDLNGRMFVWEKNGKVWIVDDGIRSSQPLIDISDEVGGWRDFGLVGFTLDPDFLSNGYIYLLYIVDRHHLINFGTSQYNPNTNEYFDATIGRITRYQAQASTNFTTVDYNSRTILFGESASTGMPSLHESHGVGQLVFGTDGTLLATLGDGASYSSVDQGSAGETYYSQGLADGIIRPDENVGAYRCQKLNSFNGKIIRIDPNTGNGIPSNPFYDSSNPRSAQSRTWALGVRNPYRICQKPETGSHNPDDADPGVFFFGDVGWGNREELNVLSQGGQNFGWPKYEGMTYQPGYNNPTYNPSTHERPKVDWRNGSPRVLVDGNIYNIGSSQFPGPTFNGNASTGGVWYTGDDFPMAYKNTYFHADYGAGWVRNFSFDNSHNPTEVENFISGGGPIVYLATSPTEGGLYYIEYPGQVRKVSYTGGANQPPVVKIEADKEFGAGPLSINFDGSLSFDPENGSITYSWDFGDGSAISTEASPSHVFSASGNNPTTYTVTLTVTDNQNLSSSQDFIVHLNNTPPNIQSVSIDGLNTFSHTTATNLSLSATVSDAEHANGSLTYMWQTSLFHNNHSHDESVDTRRNTSTRLSPLGCDGVSYWYRITLKVSDPAGLSTTYVKDLFPDCSGSTQQITFPPISDKLISSPAFPVSASSSSGLPVTIYKVDGPAELNGSDVELNGRPGYVTLRAVQGGNGAYQPAPPVERTFVVRRPTNPTNCTASGNISVEYWRGDSGRAVADIPLNTTPDETGTLNIFEIPVNDDDNYGVRIRGYICPPETGSYRFWIASDDNGQLWLSSNASPANKQLIADVPNWTNSREWNKFPEQQSALINLVAGQSYYIEALMKEQTGGDNLAIGWERPGGNLQRPIPGTFLSPWDGGSNTSTPNVTLSTSNTTVSGPFNVDVLFSESVTGLSAGDFLVTNGLASNLTGSNSNYSVLITPDINGTVTVQLPAGAADGATNPSNASNTLSITYNNTPTCDNVTGGGQIAGDESQCDPYNPSVITNITFPSGGSGALEYLWQRSTSSASGPWTSLSASGATYNPGSITQTTWYRRLARRENCTAYTGISNVVTKEVDTNCGGGTQPPSGYCSARATAPWVEWISQVNFGDIDNSSGKDGYRDQTDQRTSVTQGQNYSLEVTPGLSWPGYRPNLYWRVWIDFNRDADFSDPGELVVEVNNIGSAIIENILIPNDAALGATRMRIAMQRDEYANPCETFSNGEVEDYVVEILENNGGGGDQTRPAVSLSTSTNSVSAPFTVEIDFSENINGLSLSDFQVTNANLSGLTGNGFQYSLTMTPLNAGLTSLLLPVNKVSDAAGNGNTVSNTLEVTYTPPSGGGTAPDNYCNAIGQQPWFEWIANVSFGSIDNDSNKDLYGDFTDQSTTVNAGGQYPISVMPGFSWFQWDEHLRVWIDYNRDGDFTDPGELALSVIRPADPDGTTPTAIVGTIAVPFGASEGRTRMRVAMQREAFADPCGSFDFGEVEDYEVNIVGGGGGGNTCAITATVSNILCNDEGTPDDPVDDTYTFDVFVSGVNTGAEWEAGSITGSYGSAVTLGPYLISDGDVNLTVNDIDDAACSSTINAVAPAPCSTNGGGGGPGPLPTGYCAAQGTQPWTEWIGEVQFGDIDNSSNKELYGDFTDQSTNVTTGLTYSISITPYFSWTHRDEYIRAWIDFNRDGDFNDANELVFEELHPGGPDGFTFFPATGDITIPNSAELGSTRMRIAMNRDGFPDPCGNFINGEVEDYAVNITDGSSIQGAGTTRAVLDFAALLKGRQVDLDWITNTGYKNAYFIIERSLDGKNFMPIREIVNADESNDVMHYNQVDDSPVKGDNFYRLRQVHLNGSYVLSPVRKVSVEFDLHVIALYPNPTTDRLFVDLSAFKGNTAELKVYNLDGELRLTKSVEKVDEKVIVVNLSGFVNGFYTLTVEMPGKRIQTLNFVVNRLY